MADLYDLIGIALGTPETVNFNALYKLLTGIVQRLTSLSAKCGVGSSERGGARFAERSENSKAARKDNKDKEKDTVTRTSGGRGRKREDEKEGQDEGIEKPGKLAARKKMYGDEETKTKPSDRERRGRQAENEERKDKHADTEERKSKQELKSKRVNNDDNKSSKPTQKGEEGKKGTSSKPERKASMADKTERKTSTMADKTERKASTSSDKIERESNSSTDKLERRTSTAPEKERRASTKSEGGERKVSVTGSKKKAGFAKNGKEGKKTSKRGSQPEEAVYDSAEEKVHRVGSASSSQEDVKESQASRLQKGKLSQQLSRDFGEDQHATDDEEGYSEFEGDESYAAEYAASSTSNSFVRHQDFIDIVKRIEVLEGDVVLMKSLQKRKQKEVNVSSMAGSAPLEKKDDDISENAILHLKKMIEMVEENTEQKTKEIDNKIRNIREQLNILPKGSELYKSAFPSWKMLEDALSKPQQLKTSIQEIKDAVDTGKGATASRQIFKLIGATGGPSDSLITIFQNLTNILTSGSTSEATEPRKQSLPKQGIRGSSSRSTRKSGPTDSVDSSSHEEFMLEDELHQNGEQKGPDSLVSTVTVTTTATGGEAGFLAFKMAKLGEDLIGIRKELDDCQLWVDRVKMCEEDIKDLGDVIIDLKRDMQMKENQEHDILTALQMDLAELHQEMCGRKAAVNLETRKEEMDNMRMQVQALAPDPHPMDAIVIDREARIRTKQLQMQMNAMHHILSEMQLQLPDFQPTLPPSAVPEGLQHPWGTGRSGVGFNMRAGGGTHATVTAPQLNIVGHKLGSKNETSPVLPSNSPMEARLPPLGGREDESPQRKTQSPTTGTKGIVAGPVLDSADQAMLANLSRKDNEERIRMQQTLTRLNTAHNMMGAKLEACCNQQSSDFRRLQDLMTKMHKEYMTRVAELKIQVEEALTDDYLLCEGKSEGVFQSKSPSLKPTEIEDAKGENKDQPASGGQEIKRESICRERSTSMSAGRRRNVSSAASIMREIRQELLRHIKNLSARIKRLELNTIVFDMRETDVAGLKKPVVTGFQCLSCDRRVAVSSRFESQQQALPDLPRIAPLSSPPRLRNSASNSCSTARMRSADVYEIPRQCGGSYTASFKPRRIHYYTSLGDAIDNTIEPLAVEKVDVTGTDGHIYKGQVKRHSFNMSNNFDTEDEPVVNRFTNTIDPKTP